MIPQNFARAHETAPPARSEPKKGKSKPKRSAASVLAIAAFIVLVPLLGAAVTLGTLYLNGEFPARAATHATTQPPAQATPNAASTPVTTITPPPNATTTPAQGGQLPTPTSFKKTSSPDLNISLQYPSDWVAEAVQKSSDGSTSVGIHPSQQIPITFVFIRYSTSTSASITDAHEANQINIQNMDSAFNAQNLQDVAPANTQPVIAGTKWLEEDVTFLDANGDKLHFVTISVKRKGNYYSILFLLPDVYFSEAMQKYIQPMLNSLQFLS